MRFCTPVSILHDIRGEFNNDLILLLISLFGCRVTTTADYAPFFNGVVEKHKGIIKGKLTKLRNENFWEFSLEATIAHASFAENSLLDVN